MFLWARLKSRLQKDDGLKNGEKGSMKGRD